MRVFVFTVKHDLFWGLWIQIWRHSLTYLYLYMSSWLSKNARFYIIFFSFYFRLVHAFPRINALVPYRKDDLLTLSMRQAGFYLFIYPSLSSFLYCLAFSLSHRRHPVSFQFCSPPHRPAASEFAEQTQMCSRNGILNVWSARILLIRTWFIVETPSAP